MKDLISQVFTGLDAPEYNPLICQMIEKESISWVELQSRLLNYEMRLKQLNSTTAILSLGRPSINFSNTRSNKNYQNLLSNQPTKKEDETTTSIDEAAITREVEEEMAETLDQFVKYAVKLGILLLVVTTITIIATWEP